MKTHFAPRTPHFSSWRNTILKEFVPDVARLTLVADPDSLLSEEKLAKELRERGFDLIEFNDPIEFRYAYESKYRSIWDRGEHTEYVVILRLQHTELEALPYDLLQAGRKLSFSLGDLFPDMSYPVVEKLDHSLLDSLFDAQKKTSHEPMGDNATKDFILRHVFGVAAELVSTEVDLLNLLLRLHYGNLVMPTVLADRLVEMLGNSERFKDWELSKILPDAEQFFAFIQERWPIFLESLKQPDRVKEYSTVYELKIEGPAKLPFDHQDIRVYIDNLFVEGKLMPVELPDIEIEKGSWVLSGIYSSKSDRENLRINRLFELIDAFGLSMESRYIDWISFALKWAELSALIHRASSSKHKKRYNEIGKNINCLFADWLETHYASLINLPPSIPVMLHHLPRHIARYIENQKNNRVALLVIDGLSLDQWVTIRNIIQKQNKDIVLQESAVFAWIPTLTSVSRQSIFAGKPPIYFPSSVNSTNSEEKLWKQFWQDHYISKPDIVYKRGLGDLPAPQAKYYCYVLKCSDDSFYIGQTDCIERRLKEHKDGRCSWTKSRQPFHLIHHEIYSSREDAVKREKELKTGYWRNWLKKEYLAGKLNSDWNATRQAGGDIEEVMENIINPSQTKVVGLVIDKVDKIMHGMQLGAAGMHNQIDQWCRDEYLISLLNYLNNHGYEVWITSDHGNIEAVGKGRPAEGAIAESRGERVRIYPTPELRSRISSSFPFAREWKPYGLPDDYFPLVATGNDAFVNEGISIVGHGGVAIEEVIVPLIKIEWRKH
jgi:predicted GIY-YIG superfamily endonuclease